MVVHCIRVYWFIGKKIYVITNTLLGHTAQEATEKVLCSMKERIGKTAGAITIKKDFTVGVAFTSKRMAWAYRKDDIIYYGINQGQVLRANF